jgi:hypothetical protein
LLVSIHAPQLPENPWGFPMSSSEGNRFLAGLLDQQLWCFGQDIRRTEGNLLCQLGMCRIGTLQLSGFQLGYYGQCHGWYLHEQSGQ